MRQEVLTVSISERVMAARTARGWSQREFARKACLSYTYIQKLERGEMPPTLKTLQRLSLALELPVASLVGSEPIRDGLSDRLRQWLDTAPAEKREFVLQAAQMAGFRVAMRLAAS